MALAQRTFERRDSIVGVTSQCKLPDGPSQGLARTANRRKVGRLDPSSTIPDSPDTNEEPYYFAYSATLRIFGDLPNLDEISSALRVQPTRTHKRGDRQGSSSFPHDMWSLTPTLPKSEPLGQHIDTLWAIIKPHKHYLLELKKSATVDVFLTYLSDCETAGIEVPHTSLEMFLELEIPLGISIVVI